MKKVMIVLAYATLTFLLVTTSVGATCVSDQAQTLKWEYTDVNVEENVADHEVVIADTITGPYTIISNAVVNIDNSGPAPVYSVNLVLPSQGTWYYNVFGLDENGCRISTASAPWQFTWTTPAKVIQAR